MPAIGPDWAVSPAEWGAKENYDNWDDVFTPDDGIGLHHGGGADYPAHNEPYSQAKEIAQIRSWEVYHISKGWRGIAYGWAIGQTGTVYRLRGWNRYGAHLGDLDGDGIVNNEEIIPVVFIGSGNHATLSPAAHEAFLALRAWMEVESGHSLPLWGHKEVQTNKLTSCPGPLLMDYVEENRNLEVEVITRHSKADDGQAWFADQFQAWIDAGIFSDGTQPGGVAFNDEIGIFLERFEDYLVAKYKLDESEGLQRGDTVVLG